MKIEYLHSGSAECPVIRLCEFEPEEAITLRGAFEHLAQGDVAAVAIQELPNFHSVGNLSLVAKRSERDRGLRRAGNNLRNFELELTAESFAQLAELTAPFENIEHAERVAFQWLHEQGDARLLLSPSGWW